MVMMESSEGTLDLDGTASGAMEVLVRIFKGAVAAKASDVHLRAGQPPLVRIDGELCPLEHPPLSGALVAAGLRNLAAWSDVSPERLERMQLEFSCRVPNVGRFRVHAYRQRGQRAMVLRHIPTPIPGFADLRLPPVTKQICMEHRGLILVTGATGNGKSTTIAAMLEFINQSSCRHLVTIEDPIEFVFDDDMSSFSQREVGVDVESYALGLKGAMREDPDVIFIGEIRTLDEFDVALSAAESGHMVISTLHSLDSMSAINRMVGFYPEDRQQSARQRLSEAITAIIAQNLLPARGGKERVLVTEVLRRSPTIADCIRDMTRFRALPQTLDGAFHELGTISFDQNLLQMVRGGNVTMEAALAVARSPKDLVRQIKLNR